MTEASVVHTANVKELDIGDIFASNFLFLENIAHTSLPLKLIYLQTLIYSLQIIFQWAGSTRNITEIHENEIINVFDNLNFIEKVLSYIFGALYITDPVTAGGRIGTINLSIFGWILSGIALIPSLLSCAIFLLFKLYSFQSKMAYFSINIMISIIYPILILPLSYHITITINEIIQGSNFSPIGQAFNHSRKVSTIFLLACEILSYIISILETMMGRLIMGNTPFSFYFLFQNYNFGLIQSILYIPSIFTYFKFIFSFYPNYTMYIIYVLEIIYYAIYLNIFLYSPPASNFKYSAVSSICCTNILMLISYIVMRCLKRKDEYVHLAFVILFFVLCIVFYIIYQLQVKKAVKILAYDSKLNVVNLPLQDRIRKQNIGNMYEIIERFDKIFALKNDSKNPSSENGRQNFPCNEFSDGNLGNIFLSKSMMSFNSSITSFTNESIYGNILMNPHKAFWFLLVGIQNACDLVVDGTFQKYIYNMENFDIDLARLIALCSAGFIEERKFMIQMIHYIIANSQNPSFADKFLIFQMRRLIASRQTSITDNVDVGLNLAIFDSRQIELGMMRFWLQPKLSVAHLYHVSKMVQKGKRMWRNISSTTPNMIKVLEEELRFTIECECDFQNSIYKKRRIDFLDNGLLMSKDQGFYAMANMFPIYVKKHILRYDGLFTISTSTNEKGVIYFMSKARIGSESTSNDIFSSDLDNSENIEIAKKLFHNPKTRLAIFSATNGMNPKMASYMIIYNIIWTLIMVIVFWFLAAFLYPYFNNNIDDNTLLDSLRLSRSANSIGNMALLLRYFLKDDAIKFWETANKYDQRYWTEGFFKLDPEHFDESITNYSHQSLQYFSDCTYYLRLVKENSKYLNLSVVDNNFRNPIATSTVCLHGSPISKIPITFKASMVLDISNTIACLYEEDDYLTNNDYFCSIYSGYEVLCNLFFNIRVSIYEATIAKNRKIESYYPIFMIFLPLFYWVVSASMTLFLGIKLYKEVQKLATLLITSFSENDKKEGAKKISLISSNSEIEIASYALDVSSGKIFFIQIFSVICIYILVAALIILIFNQAMTMQRNSVNVSYWDMYNTVRIPYIVEIFQTTIFAFLLNFRDSNISSTQNEVNIALDYIKRIRDSTNNFLTTSVTSDSVVNVDDELSYFILADTCENKTDELDFISLNYCSSINHLVTVFNTMYYDIVIHIQDNVTDDSDIQQLVELFFGSSIGLIPRINNISSLISRVNDDFLYNYQTNLLVMLVIAFASIIAIFLILQSYVNTMVQSYKGGLTLLRRINPTSLSQNDELLKFLMLKDDYNATGNAHTVTKRIVYNSNDMIICVSFDGLIIEFVNPAVVSELGLSSDQLLGQFFSVIFDEKSREQVIPTMNMIVNNETQSMIDVPVICIAGDTTCINFSLSVFRANTTSGNNIGSKHLFAILRNMDEIVFHQKAAEEAKKKSETLLYHILPPSIVRKLNQGEKNVSMLVQTASIMFIDIVKFSEFSIALSPQQILGSLSSICDAYDRRIASYPKLNKIKLIGDIYMCAGGLFDDEPEPEKRACEIINFGIEALLTINDQNMKMNTNLSVRIGVNTGGPIIAGVLGTDKLQFDIIGDPINVASRLQSTSRPNQIHISEYTFSLITGHGFTIQERNMTFLKGKGNQKTYQVIFNENEE
ncbi:hypothetical protein TRFO_01563 [Tritrichomonas foetus]|uniref:Adenylate and Guanylate cyclase catalytic domain containing protein n=1 Tax=Tritrichomonas foetus TaxID=1144522 RepID=A0A1J4K2X6_9EUKA|nr:hypothetical protein TRFO_01563 [Tritrichomonas foetus]|eukprot:OHT03845.1 hypothetical protein TRFO_01563 [Tritrichomonas foetus]